MKVNIIIVEKRDAGCFYNFTKCKYKDGILRVGKQKIPASEDFFNRGKFSFILLKENGLLKPIKSPDVSHIKFKNLSAESRIFILLDEFESWQRVLKKNFWGEHGKSIIMMFFLLGFFIIACVLLDKFLITIQSQANVIVAMQETYCNYTLVS